MRVATLLLALIVVGGGGCMPSAPAGRSLSVGSTSRGFIRLARPLPPRGVGYRAVREPASSFGTERMVAFLARVARVLREQAGPGPDVRIGDLSLEGGGRIDGHGSHRAGRDADVLYFARGATGALADVGSMAFDRFGKGELDGARYQFDTARNWQLVKAMLTDADVEVQWIFCSHGLKVLLLEEALARGEDLELVRRAAWILHRPTNARPHDDHLHVRIFCTAEERAYGCVDGAPDWDWRPRAAAPAPPPSDEDILAALAPDPAARETVAAGTR